jgi:hypothetical protein
LSAIGRTSIRHAGIRHGRRRRLVERHLGHIHEMTEVGWGNVLGRVSVTVVLPLLAIDQRAPRAPVKE